MPTRTRLCLTCLAMVAGLGLSGLAQAQTQPQSQTRTPSRQPSASPAPQSPPVETLETLRRFPPVGERTAPLPGPRARPYDAERSTTPGAETTPPSRSYSPKLAPVPYDPRGVRARQPVEPEPAARRAAPSPSTPKTAAPKRAERPAPASTPAPEPTPAAPAPPPVVTAAAPVAPPAPPPPPPKPSPFPYLAAGLGGLALLVMLALIAAVVRRMMAGGAAATTFSTRVNVNPAPASEPEFEAGGSGPGVAFRVRPGGFTSQADYPEEHLQPAGALA